MGVERADESLEEVRTAGRGGGLDSEPHGGKPPLTRRRASTEQILYEGVYQRWKKEANYMT